MNKTNSSSLISFLIMAILATLLSAAIYAYMGHAVSVSVDRIDAARVTAALEEDKKSQGSGIVSLYEKTAPLRSRLKAFFIPSSNVVSFIEALESTGKQSGASVSISSISDNSSDNTLPKNIGVVRAQIKAQGTWASVMKALILAETLPYDVQLDKISLNSNGPEGKSSSNIWYLSYDIQALLLTASSSPS